MESWLCGKLETWNRGVEYVTMADLHYSPGAYAIVTGGLQKLYPSPLDFNIIDSELCRVLLALANDYTQPWLQHHTVQANDRVRYVVVVKTPTGVDGDLAVFWRLIELDGRVVPYVTAIVPGYRL
ncbi:hypothetical protein PP499_gp35 [Gordonia phage Bjanes7]|uniref:Uncharacterized protein n=5 Tax=Attisvirus TaxID=2169652 RepID=A0A7T3N378_9CAUD|nr:hypothetical protein PP494_gp31 [Gordonia phage Matteo]YP_010653680.1 hypothetical protein PP497_gp34 [Gordonia phage Lamberg]YP_010653754.1 hypothetical protein PP498_gp37 [Gordonia phage Sahara]YP_010653824.1 hypothetical protein PP499_gp35 [Gordonia phage Bjanes7]YP_010653901.1 hypothetical protein PP500_gp40 [Gordonia phage Ebert]AZS12815.1 hypothetical protein SEA_SPROUTIE_38 [Gordonia phage Sproutie]AZS12892.1 hypothetical protein SEA_SAVAGE_38 [Gordonia phage Savage]QCW22520.1 hypo